MQEVNQKQSKTQQEKSHEEQIEEVSTSGSDPTFTYDSIGDE